MHSVKNPKKTTPRKSMRKPMSHYSKSVIRWLIFCFPAGLLMMWSDRCRWSRGVKSAISVGICLALVAVVLPQTLPPARVKGGVEIVSNESAAQVQGPVQQESDEGEYDLYIHAYVQPTSLLVEPTPTPIPIYVYCNDGGKHYHNKNCRYVKKTSARVPLTQAINAGFTRCTRCNAPKEY